MKFNTTYHHSMDQGFYHDMGELGKPDVETKPGAEEGVESDMSPSDFGFSSNPFERPVEAVNARIKQGVGYIDIPFFGSGKGNKERYTPESISKKERRDIQELAKVNDVKLSTHASTNIEGLAGMGRQGFDEREREETLKEIKKAVDFASDLQGGAVVFHTGEFPRNFSEEEWSDKFVRYPEQDERDIVHMVDERNGDIKANVRKNQTVHEPVYWRGRKFSNKPYEDENGNIVHPDDYVDIDGNKLDPESTEDMFRRVPEWDPETDSFETRELTWEDFERRAEDTGRKPEEEFLKTRYEEQILQAKGRSLYHGRRYEDLRDAYDRVEDALEFYQRLEDDLPEEEKWKIMMDTGYQRQLQEAQQLVENERQTPAEILKERRRKIRQDMKHIHEASSSADVQAAEAQRDLDHIKPIGDYAVEKSTDTIARAAEYAYEKTRQNDPDRDVYVSPESFKPESYGSHPDEIRELIEKSREQFVKRMTEKKNMSASKAQELAQRHIKGTLDTGHFNLWRQHFESKEGESPEQTDKRFREWYLNQVEDLVSSDMVGQMHITDNMGFDDEHLSPGEGNIPMQEVMDIIEDEDMDDVIVEAGSFNPVDVVSDTFTYFGSPIYGAARPPTPQSPTSFRNVYQQQFGYTAPPFYVVGAYAPSNEWQLWSEVQME